MKLTVALPAFLSHISSILAGMSLKEAINESPPNLRVVLNWVLVFSQNTELSVVVEEITRNEQRLARAVPEYLGLGDAIFKFIALTAKVREGLVNGEPGNFEIVKDEDTNIRSITSVLLALDGVFEDLSFQMSLWLAKKDGEGAITKVTDAEPLEWFKLHGFTEETLKDVTIEDLKKLVGTIYGENRSIERILSVISASYFLKPDSQLACSFAWLWIYGSSEKAMTNLEAFLKMEGSKVPRELANDLSMYLSYLGDENGPLLTLIGYDAPYGLHTNYFQYMKYESFPETRTQKYLVALDKICDHIEDDINQMIGEIEDISGEKLIPLLIKQGWNSSNKEINGTELGVQLAALISDKAPISKLCNVVQKYYDTVYVDERVEKALKKRKNEKKEKIRDATSIATTVAPVGVFGIMVTFFTFLNLIF